MAFRRIAVLVGAAVCATAVAQAKTITIKGVGVKFVPDVIYAEVGDTIAFRQMLTHAVESVDSMWPADAPRMHSAIGAKYDYRVTQNGVYVFKCPSHWGARMGGILIVGKPADLNAVIDRYIGIADSDAAAKPAKALLTKFKDTLSE
jgi:plastocyanin